MTAPQPSAQSAAQRAAVELDATALLAQYRSVRHATEQLVAPLSAEDCAVQSMPDASPTKWHLAHTSWFFETFVLEPGQRGYLPFHPQFRALFNSYYNAVGEQFSRPHRALLTRPSLAEVRAFRAHVDAAIAALLESGPGLDPGLAAVFELGMHHEQQHQELILTDIKHLLAANPLRPAYRGAANIEARGASIAAQSSAATLQRVAYAPARAWIGYPERHAGIGHEGARFAFDNEMPRHRVLVPAFELASRPVTNGEYLEFMADGGYRRPELWLSDAWNELRAQGWCAPLYWEERDGTWWNFTLDGMQPVQPEIPVCHVSFYEADAYARWAGARLPTEFEWESVAAQQPVAGRFVEDGRLHPAVAPSSSGPVQLFGDVWEWTASAYAAYPGYRPATGALGEYNGKFMCNQIVLRGGSCATPASHMRATYRNFFPPAARWQWSGVRLARDAG
jgi:ergothioneine biosynthesis protein EgtB